MEGKMWHAMKEDEVFEALKTSHNGLSGEEARRRLLEYGPNTLISRGGVSPLKIFLNQFKDIFVIMLIAAVIISIFIALTKTEGGIEEYTDALTIGAIVILNAVIGFVQEYRSEKAIEAMRKLTAPKATVIRDGKNIIIPAEEVVPGDILVLETGDRVAADARLIDAIELKTNEAPLTGESTPVEKQLEVLAEDTPVSDRRNMVFMATYVLYGRGKAIVTSTGMKTEFGKIAELVQEIGEEQTPLKAKLERFAKKIAVIVVAICIIVFILEIIDIYVHGRGDILSAFFTAIALAVSAVPEGLPAVVTVCLALGARDLAKRNAIIRRLSSAETLGSVTVICSDKTGTLTKGEMTVRKIYVNDKMIEVSGVGYEPKGEFLYKDEKVDVKNDSDLSLLLIGATLCTNAQYDGKNLFGDSTEGALIVAAAKAGLWKQELENIYPRIYEVPFTSERKRMTTVHKSADGKLFAFMKGAPEIVLRHCTHILKNGKIRRLSERERKEILSINEQMANEALRVLGVAYKETTGLAPERLRDKEAAERVESNLAFIGLLGMIDPPREEAKIANQMCQKAGIKTVMITGDHKLTAMAIAKEIGIMRDGDIALTGEELERMNDNEFEGIVENVKVYARVSPEHKLRIVRALKKKGHIVAMTGDGVNDAPALKQADIGIAMGITGTDVTKEAADMVLADDNFATIVKAIEGGRGIYDNIRKFAFFLMRCNFDELFLIGTFALLGLEIPLTAGMILWLNLVTDGGPALALTVDPPSEDLMERPPRNPNEGILQGRLLSIIVTFTLQFILTGGLFYWQFYMLPGSTDLTTLEGQLKLAQARTMAFIRATLQEIFVVWNCRSEKRGAFRLNPLTNKFLVIACIVSAAATILVPFLGLFGTVWLDDPFEWTITILASLSGLLILPEVFYGRRVWRWV
ncbi:MAG: cation-translocating P-type ATPase [Nitrososphaerota archaeon]|nr:cation-translocating P-type ATPase [Candidatus Bathyarchaeota archaeon]MDW8049158.1 cation-translocating P-type ATPase [Nitrososphaerota archaeon]